MRERTQKMSAPPANRAAVLTVPPPSDAERSAQIERISTQSDLTAMHLLQLQEIMMALTEEERVQFCRLNQRMLRICRGTELYLRLTKRDYPELSASWQKYTIVGGTNDADDGSWALYYRLLQRNRQCRRAVTLYWASIGRDKATADMNDYEKSGKKQLPIEAHFMALSLARVQELFFFEARLKIPDDRIAYGCREMFGDSALPWSRFYLALRNENFAREVIGAVLDVNYRQQPKLRLIPLPDGGRALERFYTDKAQFYMALQGFRFLEGGWPPRDIEAAALILQPDGPLRRACGTYERYTELLAQTLHNFLELNSWYHTIRVFDAIGSYEEEPSSDWIFPILNIARYNRLTWQVLAYFILVDYRIAVRTGSNRRLWHWFSAGRSLVAEFGAPLQQFIELLRVEDPGDALLATLAQIDYEDASRLAEEAVARVRAAADGAERLRRGQYEKLKREADQSLTRVAGTSDAFYRLRFEAEHAASQARLAVLRAQYQQALDDAARVIRD